MKLFLLGVFLLSVAAQDDFDDFENDDGVIYFKIVLNVCGAPWRQSTISFLCILID